MVDSVRTVPVSLFWGGFSDESCFDSWCCDLLRGGWHCSDGQRQQHRGRRPRLPWLHGLRRGRGMLWLSQAPPPVPSPQEVLWLCRAGTGLPGPGLRAGVPGSGTGLPGSGLRGRSGLRKLRQLSVRLALQFFSPQFPKGRRLASALRRFPAWRNGVGLDERVAFRSGSWVAHAFGRICRGNRLHAVSLFEHICCVFGVSSLETAPSDLQWFSSHLIRRILPKAPNRFMLSCYSLTTPPAMIP